MASVSARWAPLILRDANGQFAHLEAVTCHYANGPMHAMCVHSDRIRFSGEALSMMAQNDWKRAEHLQRVER
eukprot:5698910-Pyramimonas_sp.AAC.1